MLIAQGLKKFSLLKQFSDAELESLASVIEICNFPPDTVVICEGSTASDFYLIEKGAISVLKGEVNIAWMEEGDYFGDMAIISARPRGASVRTIGDCILYKIPHDYFAEKMQTRLDVILDIAQTLEKRLRHHNNLVVTQYESLKALYDETKKNEDFFRFLNEAINDAIAVFENNEVLFLSRKVYDVFGFDYDIPISFSILMKQMAPESLKIIMHQMKENRCDVYEVEALKENGERFPLEIRPKVVNFQGRNLRVSILRDLSLARQTEVLIENQKEQIIQSAKMALLGEMVSGIAHELNNPLTVIDGFARMVDRYSEEPTGKNAEIKKAANSILKMTERMYKIIMGLRSFARDGTKDDFQESSLSQIIQDTLDFIQVKKMKMAVEVIVEGDSSQLVIQCRGVQIAEVILNLMSNSFDAVAELPERWVKVSTEDFGDQVKIMVTDSGKGIPPQVVNKMFEPFYTTKPVGKGTGLGMSISKKIIEDHNGTLSYDSTCPNTRFIVTLPKVHIKKDPKVA